MNQIYIIVLQQVNAKVTFPCQLTLYFANPPRNTDLVSAMKDTRTKYKMYESDTETVNEWIAFFEKRGFDYYASDLKRRADVRNYTEQKLKFSLSLNYVYSGTEEKQDITMTIPSSVKVNRGVSAAK